MRSPSSVKSEYRKLLRAMDDLLQKGGPGNRAPLECDESLYRPPLIIKFHEKTAELLRVQASRSG